MTAEGRSLSIRELYVDDLKGLYSAEHQIIASLPGIIQKVTSPQLKRALEIHLEETHGQIRRLEQILQRLNESPAGVQSAAIPVLLADGSRSMNTKLESPRLMDAALIGICQTLEHYEISAYATVTAFADLLGETEALDLLTETLGEQKAAEEKLTELRWTEVMQYSADAADETDLEGISLKEQLSANDSLGG